MNSQLIDIFQQLLNYTKYLYDLETDKKEKVALSFRVSSFKRTIDLFKKFQIKITSLDQIKSIPGIGKGTLARVDEILKTGTLEELSIIKSNKKYKNIQEQLKLIDNLTDIINIGPKTAKKLVLTHDITSIDDLKEKIKTKEIILNDKLMLGLKYYGIYKKNIPRSDIDEINKYITKKFPKYIIAFCGSYRRGRPTSGDIDILITTRNSKNVLHQVVDGLKEDDFLIDDLTDKDFKMKYMGFCKYNKIIRRIDIRYINYDSFYAGLLYFTGSDEFNKGMRLTAKRLGYKLNEYGLYKIVMKDNKIVEQLVPVRSEKDIFKKLGLKYVQPEDRNI